MLRCLISDSTSCKLKFENENVSLSICCFIFREAAGYEGVHGGSGYGERNADGDRVLEFAVANVFVVGNTFFVKRDSHLITYQSGNAKTQIDFILLRKRNLKMAKDIKVIPSEECVPQHKLLICELRLKTPKPHPKPFSPKLCYWKLKEPTVQEEYERGIQVQGECI